MDEGEPVEPGAKLSGPLVERSKCVLDVDIAADFLKAQNTKKHRDCIAESPRRTGDSGEVRAVCVSPLPLTSRVYAGGRE